MGKWIDTYLQILMALFTVFIAVITFVGILLILSWIINSALEAHETKRR